MSLPQGLVFTGITATNKKELVALENKATEITALGFKTEVVQSNWCAGAKSLYASTDYCAYKAARLCKQQLVDAQIKKEYLNKEIQEIDAAMLRMQVYIDDVERHLNMKVEL